MDIKKKLKIESFANISLVNFPKGMDLGIKPAKDKIEVLIYYIDAIGDVEAFVNLSNRTELPEENRTIIVFKKGRKDGVDRDTIIAPFRNGKYSNFKLKAPMFCALSDKLSAFVMTKIEA